MLKEQDHSFALTSKASIIANVSTEASSSPYTHDISDYDFTQEFSNQVKGNKPCNKMIEKKKNHKKNHYCNNSKANKDRFI